MCSDTDAAKTEREPQWYKSADNFRFGDLRLNFLAAGIYAFLALLPMIYHVSGGQIRSLPTWIVFAWGLFIGIAYPLWSWAETRSFEMWVRSKDKVTRDRERAYYSLMRDHAKSFWAGLLAVYTIASLWSLVGPGA